MQLGILIVEDQALVRAGMRALIQLTEPSAQIHEAGGFEEAIQVLVKHRIDVAFLDYDLNDGYTGLEILEHIRDKEIDAKAIMLSAYADRETVINCLNCLASGYIVKDMGEGSQLFRRALDTIFEGGVFLPASVLGRGGFTPQATSPIVKMTLDDLELSPRLKVALALVCMGLPNKLIARKMKIEEGTVRKDYLPRLFRSFNVVRRTELIIEISRRGIIIPSIDELVT